MRYALAIVGALALMASAAHAQGYNPTSVGQGIVQDCSITFASSTVPQRVLAQSGTPGQAQGQRVKVYLQNTAVNRTMGFSFTMTSNLAVTSTQQYILSGTASPNSMWQSGPDFVPMNSIFAIGTQNDVLVCSVAGPAP